MNLEIFWYLKECIINLFTSLDSFSLCLSLVSSSTLSLSRFSNIGFCWKKCNLWFLGFKGSVSTGQCFDSLRCQAGFTCALSAVSAMGHLQLDWAFRHLVLQSFSQLTEPLICMTVWMGTLRVNSMSDPSPQSLYCTWELQLTVFSPRHVKFNYVSWIWNHHTYLHLATTNPGHTKRGGFFQDLGKGVCPIQKVSWSLNLSCTDMFMQISKACFNIRDFIYTAFSV